MAPRFLYKPPAPSVHTTMGPAIERARRLRDETPDSQTELVEDIGRSIRLPNSVMETLRRNARRADQEADQRVAVRRRS